MLLLQEAAAAAGHAAGSGTFEPVLPWLIVALPLLGFVLNGVLSIVAARRALPKLPPVGDPSYDHHDDEPAVAHAAAPAHAYASVGAGGPSEQEGHDAGTDPHPVGAAHPHDAHDAHHAHGGGAAHDASDDDHAPAGPKPLTHRLPSFIAPGVMFAAFGVAVANFLRMRAAMPHHPWVKSYWDWMSVGDLHVGAALQLDQLSILMALVVTGVGALIHVFSVGYMKEDPGYPRYMAYLNLFCFFMLTLVLGASYPVMFVGWEGVGLCSYLLIGFWFTEKANADAGKKAFIVNRIGDFGFLVAMFLLFWSVGALDFQGVNAALLGGELPYAGPVITWIALFFFLGACGKSAQIPLFTWLPDAMAGPTPVSALIHAATMVTAGVYLVARSNVIFALAPAASLVVALVGALTAIFAASIGLKQWDIKKVLAYSTVSQLGFMFAAVGMGAYASGIFHLMTHAFFKACLFLGAGAVIHAMHAALHATHNPADAQDMRNMGGLRKYLPITFVTMAVSTLAIAGVPPFAGFFSKDEIVGAAWKGAGGASPLSQFVFAGMPGSRWMLAIGVLLSVAAFMTAFYMGRLMLYTFFGANRTGDEERRHLRERDWTLKLPLVVLGLLAVVGGLVNVEEHVPLVKEFNFFGQGEALHRWLHPVVGVGEELAARNAEQVVPVDAAWWPILLAVGLGLGGLALAWGLLSRKPQGDAATEPAYRGALEKVLYHKWYVDELYDAVVVRPVQALSRAFARFDMGVVDWLVDMFGRLSQMFGIAFGRLQTGQLNTYAFVLVVGVLLVLGSFVAL
ncbi:MAG TPA: NADH-quinone oxidoreductase subunit L [Longimicrobium sp.]|jgi:NADH-quinone oxidoreductase subunit L|nr:NADH-quinone oxidoreductase subunit L [Longimicrobium sp.]